MTINHLSEKQECIDYNRLTLEYYSRWLGIKDITAVNGTEFVYSEERNTVQCGYSKKFDLWIWHGLENLIVSYGVYPPNCTVQTRFMELNLYGKTYLRKAALQKRFQKRIILLMNDFLSCVIHTVKIRIGRKNILLI